MANNQPTAALSHLWWSPDGVNLVPVTATNPLPVTTAGAGGGTSSSFAAAFPATGTAVGALDSTGTLMEPLNLDASGNLKISGSITTNAADMLNITGTIGSAAVLSNFPKTDCTGYYSVAVEWTTVTAGNTAIAEWSNDGTTWTVAADQFTGATSVTAAGVALYGVYGKQFRLRCSVWASGTVAANTEFRGQVYQQNVNATLMGSSAVIGHVITDSGSVTNATLQAGSALVGKVGIDQTTPYTTNAVTIADTTATGTIPSAGGGAGTVDIATNGQGTVGLLISGTWTGTINVLGSVDGSTFAATTMVYVNSGAVVASTATNGSWQINSSGLSKIRVQGATVNTGTANISFRASVSTALVMLDNPIPTGSNIIGLVGVTAGGNTAAVKAASTPAGATDPSMVVALSPNSPVPAGSNVIGHVIADSGSTTAVTGNVTVVQPTGSNLHTVIDSGTITTVSAVTAITNALPAGSNVIGHVIADSGSTTAVTGLVTVDGGTASGSSVANPPVTIGGRAATANPTAVADGQVVNAMLDKVGRQVIVQGAPRNLIGTQKTTISASTAETTIVTAVASTFCDITAINFSNTGATATKVDLRDTTGGSIIMTFMVPAGDMRGQTFTIPVPQTTVNTNWTAQCAASTTAMEISVEFVKNI